LEHTQLWREAQLQVEVKTVNQLQSDVEETKVELAGTKATLLERSKLSWNMQPGKTTSTDAENSPHRYAVVAFARDKSSKSKSIAV